MFWKVRMIPARAILCDGSDVTSWPSSDTVPEVAR